MPTPATARRRAPAQSPAAAAPASAQQQPAAAGGAPAYLQRKLRMGQAGDAYEMEADRVADQVVGGQRAAASGQAAPGVQRADDKKQDAAGAKAGQKGDGKAAPAPEQKKDAKAPAGKDQKPAAPQATAGKDQKAAAPGAKPVQPGEKKDQVARKEVSAEDKVDKAKAKHIEQEQAKAKSETPDKPADGEEKVQAKSARPQVSRMPAGALQREASGPGGGGVGADAEKRIAASRGAGQPLPEHTRNAMESGFGEDFSGVRVHHDAAADGLAHDLDARAFAVGNDIYFAQGAYDPDSSTGQHLLAHELTHVVQQGGAGAGAGVQRLALQADSKKPGKAPAKPKIVDDVYSDDEGTIPKNFKKKSAEITIPKVKLPKVKAGFGAPPFTLAKETRAEADTQQSTHWKAATPDAAIGAALDAHLAKNPAPKGFKSGRGYYFLKVAGKDLVGSRAQIIGKLRNPSWDPSGAEMSYQIDHMQEIQLGGDDAPANLWLLEADVNQTSGRNINSAVRGALSKLILAAEVEGLWGKKDPPAYDDVRYGPTITIQDAAYTAAPAGKNLSYTSDAITAGKQLAPVKAMTLKQIKDTGLGDDSDRVLYTILTRAGGTARFLALKPDGGATSVQKDFLPGLTGATITLAKDGGTLAGEVAVKKGGKALKKKLDVKLTLVPIAGEENAFMIDKKGLKDAFKDVTVEGWSPVEFTDIDFAAGGLVASALIHIDVPIIKQGVTAELSVTPEGVEVAGMIEAGALSLPGPVQVTGGMLRLCMSDAGIGADGVINFLVDGLGTGTLGAKKDAAGCQLDGAFEGQSDTFSKFKIELHYLRSKGVWGSGEIAVGAKKLPGVESATASVTIDGANWTADGTLVPTIKQIKRAKIGAQHVDGQGMIFTGKAELGEIPCVSGGDVDVTLLQAGGAWKASGKGHVDLSIPGLDTASAAVSYAEGVFTAEVTVGYKKGMLAGQMTVGVSNQPPPPPPGAEGSDGGKGGKAAAGGAPAGPGALCVYGKGSVSIQICPWLKGTVTIFLLPDGHVKVAGEVALPSDIELLPEKKYDKTLLSIGIDIPIVGVSFAGQRIGIFATIGGSLTFNAGIGPLKLRGLHLGIEYDPQNEDATHVTGGGEIACPAHAGLRMEVHGGLGAGIPIVSATAGVEVSGELGLQGEAKAGVEVDWTRQKGLDLTAQGDITVKPVFKFDVSAYVKVEADLWVTTINLYENHWNLASFEYGSGMELGISFPVHYTEADGMNLALDQIQLKKPDIDPMSVLSGLMDKIT